MKRVEMDFYGQKVVVEFEGDENPINFLTRQLAEAKAYASRERTRALAMTKMAHLLARNGFDKPSPGARETESAYKKRLERWEQVNKRITDALASCEEIAKFMAARSAHIAGLTELEVAMSETFPDREKSMRPGGCYTNGAKEVGTIPSPWYSRVQKAITEGQSLTKHQPFDLEKVLTSLYKISEDPH